MSESTDLREAVTGLVTAAADLLKAMAERKRGCTCKHQHACWHYYQYPTLGASTVYPYTVTYGSSGGTSLTS